MSPKYQLNKEDGLKILKGACIALGGALLTYLSSIIGQINFGDFTPIVVALLSILINAGIKFLSGEKSNV